VTDTTPAIPQDAPRALVRAEGADDGSIKGRWDYSLALSKAGDVIPESLWAPVRNQDGTMSPPQPSPGKIMAVTEIARMLGMHPIAGIMGIHIIEKRPSISAALMSARIRNAGHRLRVGSYGSVGDLSLTGWATLTRKDDPDFEYRVEWDLHEAAAAGLGTITGGKWGASKNNWRQHPRRMLKARAISEVCREAAEDELLGAAYIPDELGADTDEDGAPVGPAAPTRDWEADIAGLRTIDAAAILREELRVAPDYSAALWGMLLARYGVLVAEQDAAEAPHPDDEPFHEDDEHDDDEADVPATEAEPPAPGPAREEDIVDAEIVTDAADEGTAPEGDEFDAEVLAAFPQLSAEQRAGIAALKRKSAEVTANVRPGGTA
jgi:hypothetical protein